MLVAMPRYAVLIARAGYAVLGTWMLVGSSELARAVIERRPGAGLAAAAALVILLSALVASVAGFAFCAIAGSALAWLHIDPVEAVQTMVLCSIATQSYAVWTIRAAIDWRAVLPMIVAGTATVPLGVWLLLHSDPAIYATGLGAFLIAYGGFYVANRGVAKSVDARPWHDVVAGALGGLTGGALLFAGPGGSATDRNLQMVPFALLGAIGGMAVFQRMTQKQFQVVVSALLVVSGIGLLSRVLG